MVRMLKQILLVTLVVLSGTRAWSFALLGPNNEAFQVDTIGYNPNPLYDVLDNTAVKNIGEEYRWNKPVLYYSVTENFWEFFGPNGVAAIDAAFNVLNESVTNLSSVNIDDFALDSRRENFLAQSLSLLDVKTAMLSMLVEQLGLAQPERYIWCLHNRYLTPGGQCPQDMVYDVIMRNLEPLTSTLEQVQYSKYVNGTRYHYIITEYCDTQNSAIPDVLADAIEYPIDPTASTYNTVASRFYGYGGFYIGMTRDDMAGLKYLLRTNNMNIENTGADTVSFITNTAIELLFTSNLTALAEAAFVNDAGALQAQFPGLQIAATTQYFTNVVTTNTFFYFTNYPWSPPGSLATIVTARQIQTNVVIRYQHQFANVITNNYATSATITVTTTNISAAACGGFGSPGSICTNISTTTYTTNGVFGDYYLIPGGTNSCGVSIVATQLITAVTITNAAIVATNDVTVTNVLTQQFSQGTSYKYNQHIFLVRVVVCPEDTVERYQGIDSMQFVRRDFDSLLNRFFYPVTNTYRMYALTNNVLVPRTVRRIVTTPDFLITAEDASPGPGEVDSPGAAFRSVTFNSSNAPAGLFGPGTIESGTTFLFNKVGPIYQNSAPNFLDEANQILYFIWGSFDASTNLPIVYPNGTDLANLENQVFIQLSPANAELPDANLTQDYATLFGGFTVSGATAPFAYSVNFGGNLPPGLVLNPVTGQITGIPTAQGTYDFTIRLNDATGRFVERAYAITVIP
jgi:hypothetical protein